MSVDHILLSDYCLTETQGNKAIAYHQGRYFDGLAFGAAVRYWVSYLQDQPVQKFALFTEDAYPFAVLFMALLHAGQQVWIPGNNRPGTARQLEQNGCQLLGDWGSATPFDYQLMASAQANGSLPAIDPVEPQIVLFTSGSSGEPKAVTKNLQQFQLEINALEKQWGEKLSEAEVLATVSHQHIYGLLFRILWPLSAGRCFHSSIYLNPEMLVNSSKNRPAYWVASPAHLKRLDQDSPWDGIAKLQALFSSGGALPETARSLINHHVGQPVIEIFGSTETGGIAWKTQGQAWTLFPGMSLVPYESNWRLHSPYLPDNSAYLLDDRINLSGDGCFILIGRTDRIVKVEEKRLSLIELEQRLVDSPLVDVAYGMVISQKREMVCAVIVLGEAGTQQLIAHGRSTLIRQLRQSLEPWFEAVHLPRKWLFADTLPLTAQGKIDRELLAGLIAANKQKYPLVQEVQFGDDSVKLKIIVPQTHELIYFPDHFPGYPILPGVVQLAWVEHFGQLLYGVGDGNKPFSHLEVVKFIKIISPGLELTLTLKWKENTGELQFNFSSGSEGYSSGRMVYKSG